ncbi:MAG: hypothetical protein J6K85_04285 [Clostridia bacterium]|nr:hypothetical protein [Clostridia bacterium]
MEKQDYITPIICVLLIIGMIGGCIAIFSNNSSSGGTNSSSDSEIVDDSDTSSDGASHTHMLKTVSKLLPTCTESGYAAYQYCLKCNYTTKGEDIDALGHDIISENTATCTENGNLYERCARCDYEKVTSVEAIGHEYNSDYICVSCGTPQTIVLNGTFEFKEVLPVPTSIPTIFVNYSYGGKSYNSISYQYGSLTLGPLSENYIVYELDGWVEKSSISFDNEEVPMYFYEAFMHLITEE